MMKKLFLPLWLATLLLGTIISRPAVVSAETDTVFSYENLSWGDTYAQVASACEETRGYALNITRCSDWLGPSALIYDDDEGAAVIDAAYAIRYVAVPYDSSAAEPVLGHSVTDELYFSAVPEEDGHLKKISISNDPFDPATPEYKSRLYAIKRHIDPAMEGEDTTVAYSALASQLYDSFVNEYGEPDKVAIYDKGSFPAYRAVWQGTDHTYLRLTAGYLGGGRFSTSELSITYAWEEGNALQDQALEAYMRTLADEPELEPEPETESEPATEPVSDPGQTTETEQELSPAEASDAPEETDSPVALYRMLLTEENLSWYGTTIPTAEVSFFLFDMNLDGIQELYLRAQGEYALYTILDGVVTPVEIEKTIPVTEYLPLLSTLHLSGQDQELYYTFDGKILTEASADTIGEDEIAIVITFYENTEANRERILT